MTFTLIKYCFLRYNLKCLVIHSPCVQKMYLIYFFSLAVLYKYTKNFTFTYKFLYYYYIYSSCDDNNNLHMEPF